MLSIEECKKNINRPDMTDKEIENIRDILNAFVEQTLDFVINSGILIDESCQLKKHNKIKKKKKTIN